MLACFTTQRRFLLREHVGMIHIEEPVEGAIMCMFLDGQDTVISDYTFHLRDFEGCSLLEIRDILDNEDLVDEPAASFEDASRLAAAIYAHVEPHYLARRIGQLGAQIDELEDLRNTLKAQLASIVGEGPHELAGRKVVVTRPKQLDKEALAQAWPPTIAPHLYNTQIVVSKARHFLPASELARFETPATTTQVRMI